MKRRNYQISKGPTGPQFDRIMLTLLGLFIWYSVPPEYRKRVLYQLEDERIAVNAKYGRYEPYEYDIVSRYPVELFDQIEEL